jgi:hypothetical protein
VSQFNFVKSLATDKSYVAAQARVKRNGSLHIQAQGSAINRDYGVSATIEIPGDLAEWFRSQERPLNSMACSGKSYTAIQMRYDDELECINVQVKGTPSNRGYGAAFKIHAGCADAEGIYLFLSVADFRARHNDDLS